MSQKDAEALAEGAAALRVLASTYDRHLTPMQEQRMPPSVTTPRGVA